MDLSGKTVLVTGGSRGIGRAIALALADQGAEVIINYLRHEEAAQETCALVRARGGAAEAVAADVGDPRDVRRLFDWIRARRSRLDILVHNAAIGRFKPLLRVRPAQWEMAFRTNAHALLLLAREALGLLAEPGGRIVALSSLGSHRYVPFYGAVGVSKAALENVVRYLAVELAPRGIAVNAVSGGMIDSETLRAFPQYEMIRDAVVQRTPANRLGTPEELADVVLFLCSERARWICGQTIIADGGFSLA
ncbi:MAG TPA: SDR family oxidoreductase [Verrucomicrobiae bacterium]|nr:SDR family oxidoreductase [Verrucomicrobiae bacterium]